MADSEVDAPGSDAPASDPLVGQVLSGRFEIVQPIGVGGMGRVYKAVQRPLGREVALKVLNPRYDGTKDPGFERRFFLEASMTAKLKHPNTITVHDYGRTDDGIYFIAMEYLEGETLQKVLTENGRLPWARALFIAGQVARSLREAHKLGLVHRDLKPANVMLLTEGTGGDTVKVLDFGLVKSFTPDKPKTEEEAVDRTGLTQAGVLLGSPLYMAPEQARGEADPRTDIYALGVLLFQVLAGRPPFVSRESIDVIVKHIREKPPELRSLAPEIPLEVNALVMKCLEKEPAARFQSMDELLDAMRMATAGQGLSGAFADPRTQSGLVPRTSTPHHPAANGPATPNHTSAEAVKSLELEIIDTGSQRPSRRWPLVIGVALVVVLGAGAGGLFALKAFKPAVKPVTPPKDPVVVTPKIDPPAAAADVRFEIDSTPQGASVSSKGKALGVTPFSFTVARQGPSAVQLELAFELDGYEPASLVAQGTDGVVNVSRELIAKKKADDPIKKTPKNPKGPKNPTGPKPDGAKPDGYKDDPY
ncbi:MAG: serine/threonine-protein kinase [Myxococcaceae bacterium]